MTSQHYSLLIGVIATAVAAADKICFGLHLSWWFIFMPVITAVTVDLILLSTAAILIRRQRR